MITPSLNVNLPAPAAAPSSPAKTTPLPAAPVTPAPSAGTPPAPSATVTLSPQAMNALATAHASPQGNAAGGPPVAVAATAVHDGSVYDSLKRGISTAVTDVGDAIADGAHAVVDGVETALSTANDVAKGVLELPFAAVAKACDAAGALLDEL
jgi:hypothetical protein